MSGHPPARPPSEPPGGDPYGPAPGNPNTDRTVLVLTHLAAPISWVLTAGFLGVLGPLIVWLIYRDQDPRVRAMAAGAFNFNLTCWLGFWVLVVLSLVTLGVGLIVAIPILIVGFIVALIMHLRGAMAASRDELFHYPLQLPILR